MTQTEKQTEKLTEMNEKPTDKRTEKWESNVFYWMKLKEKKWQIKDWKQIKHQSCDLKIGFFAQWKFS